MVVCRLTGASSGWLVACMWDVQTRLQHLIHHERGQRMDITEQSSARVKMGGWVDNAHYALDQLIIHLEIAHSPDASCPDIGIDRLQPIQPSVHPTTQMYKRETKSSYPPQNHFICLQQHLPGVLDVLLDLDEEGDGLPAVEQPVVVCEGEVHHGPDLDLAVDGNGLVLNGVQA